MLCECHCTCYSNEMTLTCLQGGKKCNEWNSFFPYISLYLEKWPLVTVWSFASLKMHQIQWNKKQNKDKWMYLIVDNFILVLDGRGKGKLICYTHALALSSQKKFKCMFFEWPDLMIAASSFLSCPWCLWWLSLCCMMCVLCVQCTR